jgi:excisionase family DNA binding protein
MTEKEFYTVRELAELLDVNQQTIYRLVRRGELPCHAIGRAKRFRKTDVEAFLARCRTLNGGVHAE